MSACLPASLPTYLIVWPTALLAQEGALPLSWACHEGWLDLCRLLLLQAKADPNKVDKVTICLQIRKVSRIIEFSTEEVHREAHEYISQLLAQLCPTPLYLLTAEIR